MVLAQENNIGGINRMLFWGQVTGIGPCCPAVGWVALSQKDPATALSPVCCVYSTSELSLLSHVFFFCEMGMIILSAQDSRG